MSIRRKVVVTLDKESIRDKFDSLITDDVMYEIHNVFAKLCDPYVPMQEGVLAQSLNITPYYVEYTAPYAHYQYMGLVYGPNIPIKEDGEVIGWFSPPGKKKTPTGASLSYNKEMHPLATSHWDEHMMTDKGEFFLNEVKKILERKARDLYG